MRYNPAVHSPIFGPIEKPVRVGWYAGSCIDEMRRADIVDDASDEFWWYWDGEKWMAGEHSTQHATYQNRYWFGLPENPEQE